MLTSTTGEPGASDSSGFLNEGSPAAETPFGNIASIGATFEKPSQRLKLSGSIVMPSAFVGIASRGIASR